ncbi:NAD(+) synthase [Alkalibacter saccharofermentans]|uniref:Glutamine-dependent NAD(+) synthetase n=1 Tax=Alkalibacter saccharofermentans DSM 14828 TaxID=1120975 RepID=A0A1M4UB53_9FIRM|nr:NAD(+) synthase [Alkalibacter saccharofermentans]SHE53827.1 NAD+ synthase (glutamine-hydrolysing) [Alkalibacter saccharofermentans DSM 14828]
MYRHGFYRVGCGVPELKVADVDFNLSAIKEMINESIIKNVDILLLPELAITGYTCGDLFFQKALMDRCEKAIGELAGFLENKPILLAIGAPVRMFDRIYNCGVVIQKGKILGMVPKMHLPEYNEFYEKRWFSSGYDFEENMWVDYCGQRVPMGSKILFRNKCNHDLVAGIEICEDLWVAIPPSSNLALSGATLILNPSASNDLVGKRDYRLELVKQQSARCLCAYAYASSGFGESTTDVVYGGDSMICENGALLEEGKRFDIKPSLTFSDVDVEKLAGERIKKHSSFHENNKHKGADYIFAEFEIEGEKKEIKRKVWKHPFVPAGIKDRNTRCEEIFNIQTSALGKRMIHTSAKALVVGISGGLDSTLALLACVKTCDKLGLDRKMIKAITMPGFGTTDRTYQNAISLMKNLDVSLEEISIVPSTLQHFKDIGHDPSVHNVTYENAQARERTKILMNIANRDNGMVIGTGDLSELALGWATYNGDHMSMYGINSGIPKTLVRYLVKWIADNSLKEVKETLYDVLDTPVSPELLPPDEEGNIAQKTEEVVGPYEIHDFYLYYVVRYGFRPSKVFELSKLAFKDDYSEEVLIFWLERFYTRFITQQFKRSCLPDGPKVGSINLSPRGDWRMPSDASHQLWKDEIQKLKRDLNIKPI